MRKPGTARPSRLPTRAPTQTPFPAKEYVNSVREVVTAVADAYAEHERTKQVVAQADRDKTIAVEETRRVMAAIDLRHNALQVQDNTHARDHEYRMTELKLRACENAAARAERLQRTEKVISEVTERLPAPQGRLLK